MLYLTNNLFLPAEKKQQISSRIFHTCSNPVRWPVFHNLQKTTQKQAPHIGSLFFLQILLQFQQIAPPVFQLHIAHNLVIIQRIGRAAQNTHHRQALDKFQQQHIHCKHF